MRKVGEGGFGALAQAKKAPKAYVKKSISVKCKYCEWEFKESEPNLKRWHPDGYACFECKKKERQQSKKEINAALIALAKRKGLI